MISSGGLPMIECCELPENPDQNYIYRLLPVDRGEEYYWERVDRNLGWITTKEQKILRNSVVGIAGCGGMGGLLGSILVRLGVGTIKICDTEVFDVSNINRQFGASRSTVGLSKAATTARKVREITDDTEIFVYPQGICEEVVEHFVEGCDVICDEIEFWAIGARILLHERARAHGVSILNCNTIGFGTRLFFFTPSGFTMEECLGFTYKEARCLQAKIQLKTASFEETQLVMERMLRGLLPEVPEYTLGGINRAAVWERKSSEGKSPILATNPPLATGFLADRILLFLLRNSEVKRNIQAVPEMPGYLYFDAAKMEAKVVQGKWW